MVSATHRGARPYRFRPEMALLRIRLRNDRSKGVLRASTKCSKFAVRRCDSSQREREGRWNAGRKGIVQKGVRAPLATAGDWAESAGLVVSGPGEIRFRCREDRAEDPDDAADRARPTTEVDQDDAVPPGHDCSV